ncbi:MAG: endonuclease III [Muribaculaceae bacterium]|nr:endonuclease III [Muribaculaceae bacterium]MBR5436217.1 endonuclease III [Muribaculaceae bacterium]
MTTAQRYKEVIARFETAMPVAETELHFESPFQLLVAVILSAQCTDRRVNIVTPALFEAYPTAEKMAAASVEDVLQYVKSVTYPNSKAAHLVEMARIVTERFGGEIPDDFDHLISLPGVGRKTANVILAVNFGKPRMAVDTHVFRVSERIGLTTNSRTPLATERALCRHIPEEIIPKAHHWLILHGRYVCKAQRPQCGKCCVADVCRHNLKSLKSAK